MIEDLSCSQQEILDAAAECFMQMGPDVASIDDIARLLGSTKGRVYHHFRSKGELLYAVRLRSVSLLMEKVRPIAMEDKPPVEKLRAMSIAHVLRILKFLSYHRVVSEDTRMFFRGSAKPQEMEMIEKVIEMRRAYENLYRTVLQEGIEAGVFARQSVSITLHSIIILMNGPCFWYSPRAEQSSKDLAEIAQSVSNLVLRAVLTDPALLQEV
ncbi:putative HTH-type transcriptional regulator TtgW [Pseudovibrio axinellae]|uniref:Putative HTH-type transcriptional regulator TtgW n=1 Tax=Pseudovibrio axinellae TaxID=989403 RepID=A0A165XZA3_9HYPH|nr:TetR/AcrR family transcriptional regulator [Pseudovibrio axinellae]KZL18264.1 putative HTH-type transcriptional regulator TtgW [Pseudovibrio axinellae]SER72507.1 transcriptional regulator, TetR family [Pseudovibrio axinellae]